MRGLKFLSVWLIFGTPSAVLAAAACKLLDRSAFTMAAAVALVEVVSVMSGVLCTAAKQADKRMHSVFEE